MRIEALRAMIGLISGAMSIAPITTAVESDFTPKVAMAVAKLIRAANRRVPSDESHPSKIVSVTWRRRPAPIEFDLMTLTRSSGTWSEALPSALTRTTTALRIQTSPMSRTAIRMTVSGITSIAMPRPRVRTPHVAGQNGSPSGSR
ncbi:MAG: hypothetical protein U9N56_11900 [Actinomycetota bacterium]|nr:hypothetical protein [Actinomycetota bacterium]